MDEIDWRKIRRPKFEKDTNGKEWATLEIPLWKKTGYIQFLTSEKDKLELKKMSCWEITENFIHQKLTNRGKNGYFEDTCPKCEQPTLTKLPIADSHREAMACGFCNWAGPLERYLDYKKENSPFSYGEWLTKRR